MTGGVETVAFYSYRGGTGRSTALANVAYALAESGADVGCIDLHMNAPDLHRTFPDLGVAHLAAATTHDYLRDADGDVDNYIIDVGEKIETQRDEPLDGELLLIAGDVKPPGKGNPMEMMKKALKLREDFVDRYDLDYLLLDSQPGLSNHMIPLFDIQDQFLVFHRWTSRDKAGIQELAKWLDDVPSPGDMTTVASNVPNSVEAQEIEDWTVSELHQYDFSDQHVINRSEQLERVGPLMTMTAPDTQIAEQYRQLADQLK